MNIFFFWEFWHFFQTHKNNFFVFKLSCFCLAQCLTWFRLFLVYYCQCIKLIFIFVCPSYLYIAVWIVLYLSFGRNCMMMTIQRFLCVKNTQLFLKSFILQWKQVVFLPKCHWHFWIFSPLLITIQHFSYFWNTFFIEFLLISLMLCFRKSLLFENAAFWTFWWWMKFDGKSLPLSI